MTIDAEIAEQPAVLQRLIDTAGPSIVLAAERFRAAGIEAVTIAARGTSDHAAIYAQYVLGWRNRLPVALAAPSLTSIYHAAPRLRRTAVVGISQSGASPDVVAVLEAARAQGQPTLAITNAPGSRLALAADLVIDLGAGPEVAIAATKTYTAELLAVAMLSAALDGRDPSSHRSIRRVPSAVHAALEDRAGVESAAGRVAGLLGTDGRALVLGRGLEYPTAREWSLKLKELARIHADPYSTADFAHGPLTLVRRDTVVLAVVGSGPTLGSTRDFLDRLRGLGAALVILSDAPALRDLGSVGLRMAGGLPEWLRPISSIVTGQLFAVAIARRLGTDPEAPAHLTKVTRTH